MPEKVVPLSKQYPAHGKSFKQVVLREPTFNEIYIEGLGRPQEWQRAADGSMVMITYPTVIAAYLERIVTEPGYECITGLNPIDSMKLEQAVCGFFLDTTASKKPSTSSSSSSAGRRPRSKA